MAEKNKTRKMQKKIWIKKRMEIVKGKAKNTQNV